LLLASPCDVFGDVSRKIILDRVPLGTVIVCLSCMCVTSGYLFDSDPERTSKLLRWGMAAPDAIWSGHRLWAIVTSTFLHESLSHLTVNVFWLAIFSRAFESTMGTRQWLCFYLGACFVCTGISLGVIGEFGPGASSVLSAFVGFAWIARRNREAFANVLTGRLFFFFILLLVALWVDTFSRAGYNAEANSPAHLAGLLYGILFAKALLPEVRSRIWSTALIPFMIVCVVFFVWVPWSPVWLSTRAISAYDVGHFRDAEDLTLRSLEEGQDPLWCWQLLARIYAVTDDANKFDAVMAKIEKLDPMIGNRLRAELAPWRKSSLKN
jgi:membrane associated rhomboid family serine protease